MFQISGREMFEFNPDLVGEDDDEATDGVIERETYSDDEVCHIIYSLGQCGIFS
jgi:hypothetical protein